MIYFTADMHFGHRAIITMQNRPFGSVEEMDRVLLQNYNSVVRKEDTVYILGDICHHMSIETEESIEEHKMTVLKFISRRQALCVKDNKEVVGVLLFSRNKNMICCLAVSPEHRKRGIASALLIKALSELDRNKDITVSTFRDNDDKGIAPRALYKGFGFEEGELTKEFGYSNQVFVLRS